MIICYIELHRPEFGPRTVEYECHLYCHVYPIQIRITFWMLAGALHRFSQHCIQDTIDSETLLTFVSNQVSTNMKKPMTCLYERGLVYRYKYIISSKHWYTETPTTKRNTIA
jgi:hypothetical protein